MKWVAGSMNQVLANQDEIRKLLTGQPQAITTAVHTPGFVLRSVKDLVTEEISQQLASKGDDKELHFLNALHSDSKTSLPTACSRMASSIVERLLAKEGQDPLLGLTSEVRRWRDELQKAIQQRADALRVPPTQPPCSEEVLLSTIVQGFQLHQYLAP